MSAKVTAVCGSRSYRLKRNAAERKVRRGGFRWLDRFTIVEIQLSSAAPTLRAYFDGFLGTGNLLPFARSQNPLRYPERLHYSIPAVGAPFMRMSVKAINLEVGADELGSALRVE